MNRINAVLGLLKKAIVSFVSEGRFQMSAALAYYTVFALPGLLIVGISVAGIVFDAQEVVDEVLDQTVRLLGGETSRAIGIVIDHVQNQTTNVSLTALIGIGTLLFGATGAFAEMQGSLNKIWGVQPDPAKSDLHLFFKRRVLSFGMVLSVGFILLVSLLLSALLSILGKSLDAWLPGMLSATILQIFQSVFFFVLISILFAAIFKVLPDADVAWKDVLVGAVVTALTFVVGKELIGLYLGNSNVGSAYGAASSLVVLLVWVFFSSFAIFWGAEFTREWIQYTGRQIQPRKGAVKTADVAV